MGASRAISTPAIVSAPEMTVVLAASAATSAASLSLSPAAATMAGSMKSELAR